MYAVGIKRVFWTNAEGEWEGEKVRVLVDALVGGHDNECGEHGSEKGGLSMYVTKHDVFQLRRTLGC
jgi:hypothetical protein